jgi:hypothetical protein
MLKADLGKEGCLKMVGDEEAKADGDNGRGDGAPMVERTREISCRASSGLSQDAGGGDARAGEGGETREGNLKGIFESSLDARGNGGEESRKG